MKACTVPLMVFLHIGQSTIAGAQVTQHTRCPHGRKIMPTTVEKQILHVSLVSKSLALISSGGSGFSEAEGEDDWVLCTWGVSLLFSACVAVPATPSVVGVTSLSELGELVSCTNSGNLSGAGMLFCCKMDGGTLRSNTSWTTSARNLKSLSSLLEREKITK